MGRSQYILLVSLAFAFLASANAVLNIDVVSYGAKTDGKTDSTQAFLKAWDSACASTQPVRVYVPNGRYLIKQVTFQGPCKNSATSYQIDGTLVAPNYNVLNTANWIYFSQVNGLSITGGTLDGQATSFWACRTAGRSCPGGARVPYCKFLFPINSFSRIFVSYCRYELTQNLEFGSSTNVRIKGLTTLNSQVSHIVINKCNDVLLQGLTIAAPANSPNTDGIHIQFSTGVTIRGTSIKTGDDCVSIGPGTQNLMVEGSSCGPGHGIR